MQQIASLPKIQRTKIFAQLTDEQAAALVHSWEYNARDEQLSPEGDWRTWLFIAGRGSGKTRAGAEWVRNAVKCGYSRIALIAPTAADARDVMVEGSSGVMSVAWEEDVDEDGLLIGRPEYEPSKRRLTWKNGALATMFSAEEPDRLRGPQHDLIWADELATWNNLQEAWDMAMFGLRLGRDPKVLITTTPKPLPLLREILKAKTTVISRATTYANRANLAPAFFTQIVSKYEGTRLGRQEISGELLEEAEGALWNRNMIEAARLREPLPRMKRIVVGVDPAITNKAESNLTGIVAAGLGVDGRGYLLADSSGRFTPDGWASRAVAQFDSLKADRIVAEGNQGGEMVRHTIQSVRKGIPVSIVHASRGKQARAEPIAALYEQGKISHAQPFADLEDQMCTWEPLGDMASPDRIDAMVWAFTELMVTAPAQAVFGTYGQD